MASDPPTANIEQTYEANHDTSTARSVDVRACNWRDKSAILLRRPGFVVVWARLLPFETRFATGACPTTLCQKSKLWYSARKQASTNVEW